MTKNLLFLSFFIIGIFHSTLKAQDGALMAVKTNPLGIISGPINLYGFPLSSEYKLGFESLIAPGHAMEIMPGLLTSGILFNPDSLIDRANTSQEYDVVANGYRIQTAYKYYFAKNGIHGAYIGPHFSYAQLTFKDKLSGDYLKISQSFGTMKFGYQVAKNMFAFDIFLGVGRKSDRNVEVYSSGNAIFEEREMKSLTPIKLQFGFNFGVAF